MSEYTKVEPIETEDTYEFKLRFRSGTIVVPKVDDEPHIVYHDGYWRPTTCVPRWSKKRAKELVDIIF